MSTDRYRLGAVIGVGSYATVHLARDDRLDADVVVKLLAENHSLNPEIRERFIAEGRGLRRVHSPHVIEVFDLGENDRLQPYLVLEYAQRGTLDQRVEQLRATNWRATAADILAVARPLAAALQAIHAAHLVHRDLSPGNVLLAVEDDGDAHHHQARTVRADERLVLSDLGMCKDLALNSGLTVAAGTSGFRPPEQSAGPAMVDGRADIWAASALLRWLAKGAILPAAFESVLQRGMAERPQDRFQDAATWLAELESALAPSVPAPSVPVTAPVSNNQSSGPTGVPTPAAASPLATPQHDGKSPHNASTGRGRFLGWIAGIIAAGLLGFGVGWLVGPGTQPPSSSGESSVAISGPDDVAVGETATLNVEASQIRSWVWVLPTGEYVADVDTVELTPTGAGIATVELLAVATDGTQLHTEFQFRVN